MLAKNRAPLSKEEVENAVLLEIKAHHQPLNADELAQVLDYFAAYPFHIR